MSDLARVVVCGFAQGLAALGDGRAWVAASEDGSVGLDWKIFGRHHYVTFDRTGAVEWWSP